MNVILVDPPMLRQAGENFRRLADRVRRLGKEVLQVTGGAPSYDGDFGPRVLAGGVELYAHYEAAARLAEEAGEFLVVKADEFETADRASLEGLAAVGAQIRGWTEAINALLLGAQPAPTAGTAYQFHELSLAEIEAMTVEERIAWVRAFNEQHGGEWFFNFVDILYYFKDSQIFHGMDGSTAASEWLSWGDAATLLVVQDGFLLSRNPTVGLSELPEGVPREVEDARRRAAQRWEEFFRHLERHREDEIGLRRRWSIAEQGGIDYATSLADIQIERSGMELTGTEQQAIDTFVRSGNIYRWAVPPEHGVPLLGEVPGAFGEMVGQSLGQGLEDRARGAVDEAARQVEEIAGQDAGQFVDQVGGQLVGEGSPLGALDEVVGSAGEWVGERVEEAFEGQLAWLGEEMFDPRLHLGVALEAQTPFVPLSVQAEVRGPVYYLSMAIEGLLLEGQDEMATKALERLELMRTQLDELPPQ